MKNVLSHSQNFIRGQLLVPDSSGLNLSTNYYDVSSFLVESQNYDWNRLLDCKTEFGILFFYTFPIFDFTVPSWTRRWICGIPGLHDYDYNYTPGINSFRRRYFNFSTFTPYIGVAGFQHRFYDKVVYNFKGIYPSLRLITAMATPRQSKTPRDVQIIYQTKGALATQAMQPGVMPIAVDRICVASILTEAAVHDHYASRESPRLSSATIQFSHGSAVFHVNAAPQTTGMTTGCAATDTYVGESYGESHILGVGTSEAHGLVPEIQATEVKNEGLDCLTQFRLDGRCSLFAVPNVDDLDWSTPVTPRVCNTASSTTISITHDGIYVFSAPVHEHPTISHVEFHLGAQRVKGLRNPLFCDQLFTLPDGSTMTKSLSRRSSSKLIYPTGNSSEIVIQLQYDGGLMPYISGCVGQIEPTAGKRVKRMVLSGETEMGSAVYKELRKRCMNGAQRADLDAQYDLKHELYREYFSSSFNLNGVSASKDDIWRDIHVKLGHASAHAVRNWQIMHDPGIARERLCPIDYNFAKDCSCGTATNPNRMRPARANFTVGSHFGHVIQIDTKHFLRKVDTAKCVSKPQYQHTVVAVDDWSSYAFCYHLVNRVDIGKPDGFVSNLWHRVKALGGTIEVIRLDLAPEQYSESEMGQILQDFKKRCAEHGIALEGGEKTNHNRCAKAERCIGSALTRTRAMLTHAQIPANLTIVFHAFAEAVRISNETPSRGILDDNGKEMSPALKALGKLPKSHGHKNVYFGDRCSVYFGEALLKKLGTAYANATPRSFDNCYCIGRCGDLSFNLPGSYKFFVTDTQESGVVNFFTLPAESRFVVKEHLTKPRECVPADLHAVARITEETYGAIYNKSIRKGISVYHNDGSSPMPDTVAFSNRTTNHTGLSAPVSSASQDTHVSTQGVNGSDETHAPATSDQNSTSPVATDTSASSSSASVPTPAPATTTKSTPTPVIAPRRSTRVNRGIPATRFTYEAPGTVANKLVLESTYSIMGLSRSDYSDLGDCEIGSESSHSMISNAEKSLRDLEADSHRSICLTEGSDLSCCFDDPINGDGGCVNDTATGAYIEALGVVDNDQPTLAQWWGGPMHTEWCLSWLSEFTQFFDYCSVEIVPRTSEMRVMKSTTRYVVKRNPDGTIAKLKSRICACGYSQIDGLNFNSDSIFSPVASATSFRVLMAIAAARRLPVYMADVKGAFHQSEGFDDTLDEPVFMEFPDLMSIKNEKTGQDYVLRLKSAVYGMKQASAAFYATHDKFLREIGFKPTDVDQCLYLYEDGKGEYIYILSFVDDCPFVCSSDKIRDWFVKVYTDRFDAVYEGQITKFLGMEITADPVKNIYTIKCERYIEKIVERAGRGKTQRDFPARKDLSLGLTPQPMSSAESILVSEYKIHSLVGSVNYAITMVRPDCDHVRMMIAKRVLTPDIAVIKAMDYLLDYMYTTKSIGLSYGSDDLEPVCIADASGARVEYNGGSPYASFVSMSGAAVWWKVGISTYVCGIPEAEAMATLEAADPNNKEWREDPVNDQNYTHLDPQSKEAPNVYSHKRTVEGGLEVRNTLAGLGIILKNPSPVLTDCEPWWKIVTNVKATSSGRRHFRIAFLGLKQKFTTLSDFVLGHVRGGADPYNPADINTKCGSNLDKFQFLRDFYMGGRKIRELNPRFKSTAPKAIHARLS